MQTSAILKSNLIPVTYWTRRWLFFLSVCLCLPVEAAALLFPSLNRLHQFLGRRRLSGPPSSSPLSPAESPAAASEEVGVNRSIRRATTSAARRGTQFSPLFQQKRHFNEIGLDQHQHQPYRLGLVSYCEENNKHVHPQQQQQQPPSPPQRTIHAYDPTEWMTLPSKELDEEQQTKNRNDPAASRLENALNQTAAMPPNSGNGKNNHTKAATTKNATKSPARSIIQQQQSKPTRSSSSSTTTTTKRKPSQHLNLFAFANGKSKGDSLPPSTPTSSSSASSSISSGGRAAGRLLPDKQPNDVVTVADLESVLQQQSVLAQQQRYSSDEIVKPNRNKNNKDELRRANEMPTTSSPSSNKGATRGSSNKKTVAFPQPSVLSYNSVKWGATTSAGTVGMVLAASLAPNLWLVGLLAGSLYGYETGQGISKEPHTPPTSVVPSLIVKSGRKLAKAYLNIYDAVQTFWFMYKTGQLSYEYYQRYAELDNRFAIQSKVDAWNARFVQGKISFDKWERENEVGRKALAALRTVWLVEERSLRKNRLLRRNQKRRSKYRLIQFFYDASFTLGQLCGAALKHLTGGPSRFKEFLRGAVLVPPESSNSDRASRVGGVVAALVVANLTGAFFTISPTFLAVAAMIVGWVWPSWFSELTQRTTTFVEETRARGRGRDADTAQLGQTGVKSGTQGKRRDSNIVGDNWWSSFVANIAKPRESRQESSGDKSRYHYYRTLDGKKRYYRTGTPWWNPSMKRKHKRKEGFRWPWRET